MGEQRGCSRRYRLSGPLGATFSPNLPKFHAASAPGQVCKAVHAHLRLYTPEDCVRVCMHASVCVCVCVCVCWLTRNLVLDAESQGLPRAFSPSSCIHTLIFCLSLNGFYFFHYSWSSANLNLGGWPLVRGGATCEVGAGESVIERAYFSWILAILLICVNQIHK